MNFHKKALLIGAVTVFLSAISFLWIVVLNKGVLSVVGPAPFSVRAQGNAVKIAESVSCATSPCRLKLPTGEYDLVLSKEEYYDEMSTARISRGDVSVVEVAFSFIPHLKAAGEYGDFVLAESAETLAQLFRVEIDSAHSKQRLVYTDPITKTAVTWAYFDRDLVNPLIFPAPDLKQALVVDRAAVEEKLYWIDGVEFKRSYVGTLVGVDGVLWGNSQDNGPEVLIRTVATRSGEAGFWLTDLENAENSMAEWPFDLELDEVAWDDNGHLIFLTTQDLSELEGSTLETPMDAAEAILKGEISTETTAFSVAQYQPQTGQYRVLLEVPVSLGLNSEAAFLMKDPKDADRILVTDGEKVYELARE